MCWTPFEELGLSSTATLSFGAILSQSPSSSSFLYMQEKTDRRLWIPLNFINQANPKCWHLLCLWQTLKLWQCVSMIFWVFRSLPSVILSCPSQAQSVGGEKTQTCSYVERPQDIFFFTAKCPLRAEISGYISCKPQQKKHLFKQTIGNKSDCSSINFIGQANIA